MSETFPKVGFLRRGYRAEQVDNYFQTAQEIYEAGEINEMDSESVRTVAFDITRGGYSPQAVDEALDRLESAFIQRRRAEYVATQGRQAWMEQVAELATSLYPRLLRPQGERFADAKHVGYAKAEVDAFMERVAAYFDSTAALTSTQVRNVTFPAARKSHAYAEASVDRYLARVIEVLLAVE